MLRIGHICADMQQRASCMLFQCENVKQQGLRLQQQPFIAAAGKEMQHCNGPPAKSVSIAQQKYGADV